MTIQGEAIGPCISNQLSPQLNILPTFPEAIGVEFAENSFWPVAGRDSEKRELSPNKKLGVRCFCLYAGSLNVCRSKRARKNDNVIMIRIHFSFLFSSFFRHHEV
ncbi:hypothetical protein TWF970_005011 [Orbilia oligospora]|uniref:Uncharacterized protein n=1 Tax=Orbilia oligospora TaxID=2813651 RepID=A0A7C8RCJ8_ORBOL|nr:hypothetical protein TWF970_005011 [Orbilia oligospora]